MRQLLIPLLLFAVSSTSQARPHQDDESLYENLNRTLLEIAQTHTGNLTIEELSAAFGRHIPPEHRDAAEELLQYRDDRPFRVLLPDMQKYGTYDQQMAAEFSRAVMRRLLDKHFVVSKHRSVQPGDYLCRCNVRECGTVTNELYAVVGPELSHFCRTDKYGLCMEGFTKENKTILYCAPSHATPEMKRDHNKEDFMYKHKCMATSDEGKKCCRGVMCNDLPGYGRLDTAAEIKVMELDVKLTVWKAIGVFLFFSVLFLAGLLFLGVLIFFKFGNYEEMKRKFAAASQCQVRRFDDNATKFTQRLFNEADEPSHMGSSSPLIPPNLMSSFDATTTVGMNNSTNKTTKTFYDMETTIGCGTGAGGNLVATRTLSSFIRLTTTLGQGKFGKVFLGEWRGGEKIAVKKFDHVLYDSFVQEVEILMTGMMSNSNILRWIGKDTVDTGSTTEFWIMSEYHPNGSLFDYMEKNALTEVTFLMMMRGIANGISFLHSEIPENEGTTGKKGVAHRDLKTKNILVKSDLTCVIADFGMAVINNTEGVRLPPGYKKSGTVRYLSPEGLIYDLIQAAQRELDEKAKEAGKPIEDKPTDKKDKDGTLSAFEHFRASDMYSFGLIMWECARRSRAGYGADEIAEHSMEESLAYYTDVPREPSVEDMREAVVTKGLRPICDEEWNKSLILSEMSRMMRECWSTNASARLTALNVKIAIDRLAFQLNLSIPTGPE